METSLVSGTPPTVVAEIDRHHLVAVAAEDGRLHVLHGRARLPGDERLETRRVEDPGLAEDALLGKAGDVLGDVTHRVQRVRDDDQGRVGRLGDRSLGDGADDLLVRRHEVVPAHVAGARDSGGDDDDVRARCGVVARRAGHVRLVAEHCARLVDVERLALWQALLDVDEHDIAVVAPRELLRARCADVPGPDDRHLAPLAQTVTPICSMIASATSLVPTALGSSRDGFMS